HQAVTKGFFFLPGVVKLQHTFAGTGRAVDFLDFGDQAREQLTVPFQQPGFGFNHQVANDGRILLTKAVDTPVSLDQCDDGPGQIVMYDVVALVVQVHTFGCYICGQHQPNRAVTCTKGFNSGSQCVV